MWETPKKNVRKIRIAVLQLKKIKEFELRCRILEKKKRNMPGIGAVQSTTRTRHSDSSPIPLQQHRRVHLFGPPLFAWRCHGPSAQVWQTSDIPQEASHVLTRIPSHHASGDTLVKTLVVHSVTTWVWLPVALAHGLTHLAYMRCCAELKIADSFTRTRASQPARSKRRCSSPLTWRTLNPTALSALAVAQRTSRSTPIKPLWTWWCGAFSNWNLVSMSPSSTPVSLPFSLPLFFSFLCPPSSPPGLSLSLQMDVVHTRTSARIHPFSLLVICVCVYACACACACVYVYIYMCTRMCVCNCICTCLA